MQETIHTAKKYLKKNKKIFIKKKINKKIFIKV